VAAHAPIRPATAGGRPRCAYVNRHRRPGRNTWDHADEVPFKNPMEDAVKVAIESGGAEAGVKTIGASVRVGAEAA